MAHDGQHPGARDASEGVTKRKLTPERVKGDAWGARVLHRTLERLVEGGDDACTQRACAKRAGIKQGPFQRMCNPVSGASTKVGELYAMGPTVLRAFLRNALADLDDAAVPPAEDPQKIALQVTGRVGRLASEASAIVEDKVVTDPEWERFDARLAAIESEVAAARAAVRARLRAGEGR